MRYTQAAVGHLFCDFAEYGLQELFFCRESALLFGSQFGDQNVAGIDVAADFGDAALVQVLEVLAGHVGHLGSENFRTAQGLINVGRMFFDFDVGQFLIFDQTFSDDDRVFEVVTAPGHEGYEQIAAECQFALVDTGTVSDDLTGFDLLSDLDRRALVEDRVLVRSVVANKRIVALFARWLRNYDFFAGDAGHGAGAFCRYGVTGRATNDALHACSDARTLRLDERQSLAHHATTHEGSSCIVVLQEWNKSRTYRQETLRCDTDHVDVFWCCFEESFTASCRHERSDELIAVYFRIGRCQCVNFVVAR